jgi:hypothetical protein
MCSLTLECVLLLTIECVLLRENVFSYYRMCSLAIECVLLLQNVLPYIHTSVEQADYLAIECVLIP